MELIVRKVMVSEKQPKEPMKCYDTNLGSVFYFGGNTWSGLPHEVVDWWLEEIELPSEEEKQVIVKKWYHHQQFKSNYPAEPSSFMAGFNKAIELIKGGK